VPPVISIVGRSKSGKTTLIEGLLAELKARGYRMATVKHASGKLAVDRPGKDSWRHIAAGSEATIVASPTQTIFIKPTSRDPELDELVHLFGEEYHIVLAEGFKQSSVPKIEVHRKEAGPPLADIRGLIAIATDEHLDTETRQFALHDIKGLADFLESGFIRPQKRSK